jgi:predicted nucleic acid-binding protein
LIAACTVLVHPKAGLNVITEDPDDNRILECAGESGSDTIVTGDKDLLRRGEYQEIRIVPIAEFLAAGQQRG